IAPLLEGLTAARDTALAGERAPEGQIRLTASVAFGTVCLVPHIAAFRASYPGIDLELMLSDAPLDLLSNGVDIALRLAPAPKGDLVTLRLRRTRYRVVASPRYLAQNRSPKAPEDLRTHLCLHYALPEFGPVWRFRKGGKEDEVRTGRGPAISSALALREAAKAGLGPALLADWLIHDHLADGRLIDLFPDHEATATSFDTGAYLLYPSRSHLPARARVTIDFLRSVLRT
ncbi:MAG: substrate binding domain-containing protein, partial [Pseudomonadota bacterium]